MPILLQMKFSDGSTKMHRIPAEIWRKNTEEVTKVFVSEKEVMEFEIDPYIETADTERGNNYFPERNVPTRFQLYKSRGRGSYGVGSNPMREDQNKR